MKKLTHLLALGVIALAVLAGTTSYAQLTDTLEVNIPFRFYAGDTHLPAGEYSLQVADYNSSEYVLDLSNANDSVDVLLMTNAAQIDIPTTEPALDFKKIGGQYFLTHIWVEGSKSGYQVVEPYLQKQLEKQGQRGEMHRVEARHKHL
jgi:hypothetical protein